MHIPTPIQNLPKQMVSLLLIFLLSACSDGGSTGDASGGTVSGVATPSKVSVVTTE